MLGTTAEVTCVCMCMHARACVMYIYVGMCGVCVTLGTARGDVCACVYVCVELSHVLQVGSWHRTQVTVDRVHLAVETLTHLLIALPVSHMSMLQCVAPSHT